MMSNTERPRLHVEGPDDFHTLVHLLIRNGIDYDAKPWPAEFSSIEPRNGIDNLLEEMAVFIEMNTGRAIGFVLDADSPLDERWRDVCGKLSAAGVAPPEVPPAEGFVAESLEFRTRVGVWLMPDNQHEGKLEDFPRELVAADDTIIEHAEEATRAAKELGAEFQDIDKIKAVMHTWLAWQEEPGLPFGAAIRARYFGHDGAAANVFVSWFRKLYEIEIPPAV